MSARRQQGVTIAIVLVVLALVMVAFMASYALSRLTGSSEEREKTEKRLRVVADALEQYAASAKRLPCPANPQLGAAAETGVAVPDTPTSTCTHGNGVVPWKTIGLRRDDAYDGWGRRISYRVYTGSEGSLTQAGGISMVDCDTVEPDPLGKDTNGLCRYDGVTVQSRRTPAATFLLNKGLQLNDMGTSVRAAYVLISHGATGGGAFTASGARVEMPGAGSHQRDHTTANGPFYIERFSDVEESAKSAGHFDDVLAYRSLADLVKRVGLAARDWLPDTPSGSLIFDRPTVTAAATPFGATVSGTDTGTHVLDFANGYVVGIANSSLANISIDDSGTAPGIGVVAGSNPKMSYSEREGIAVLFDLPGTKFAITLNDFGTYTQSARNYTETLVLSFADENGNAVSPVMVKSACRADGGLATFVIDVGATYRWAYIFPGPATASSGAPGDTAFLISEVRTCASTEAQCRTSLWHGSNACS